MLARETLRKGLLTVLTMLSVATSLWAGGCAPGCDISLTSTTPPACDVDGGPLAPCPNGQVRTCINVCAPTAKLDASCSTNACDPNSPGVCATGSYCAANLTGSMSGTCIAFPPRTGGLSETCGPSGACDLGLYCNSGSSKCVVPGGQDTPCETTSQCSAGLTCSPLLGTETCTVNSPCTCRAACKNPGTGLPDDNMCPCDGLHHCSGSDAAASPVVPAGAISPYECVWCAPGPLGVFPAPDGSPSAAPGPGPGPGCSDSFPCCSYGSTCAYPDEGGVGACCQFAGSPCNGAAGSTCCAGTACDSASTLCKVTAGGSCMSDKDCVSPLLCACGRCGLGNTDPLPVQICKGMCTNNPANSCPTGSDCETYRARDGGMENACCIGQCGACVADTDCCLLPSSKARPICKPMVGSGSLGTVNRCCLPDNAVVDPGTPSQLCCAGNKIEVTLRSGKKATTCFPSNKIPGSKTDTAGCPRSLTTGDNCAQPTGTCGTVDGLSTPCCPCPGASANTPCPGSGICPSCP